MTPESAPFEWLWRAGSPAAKVALEHDAAASFPITAAHRQRSAARSEAQRQAGRRVDNLPLYWVREWRADERGLQLRTGASDYETYLGAAPHEAVLSLTICAALRTPDGLVLERRSNAVAEGSGLLHVKPSGHVHPPESPETSLLRETQEELGLEPHEVRLEACLGLVRSGSVACAALVYLLVSDLTLADIHGRHRSDDWEADDLFAIPSGAAPLRAWLEEHASELTGIGLACLLATGAHLHGPAWLHDSPLAPSHSL